MSSKKKRNDVGSGPGENIDIEDKINAAMDKIMRKRETVPKGNTNRTTESLKQKDTNQKKDMIQKNTNRMKHMIQRRSTNQRKTMILKRSTAHRKNMTKIRNMLPGNMMKKDMMSRKKKVPRIFPVI